MKKIIKLSMITLAVNLVAGCATTSDVEKLQSQVESLNTSVAQASADAASAQTAANDASEKAEAAEAAANRANRNINRNYHKKFKKKSILNKKLKSSMMK